MRFTTERLTYDPSELNFSELALNELNQHLQSCGREPIAALSQVHTVPGIADDVEPYRQLLFQLFRKPDFQSVYRALGRNIIETRFTDQALLHKTPI